MRDAPTIEASVGALHLHTDARRLVIEGASAPVRVAVFRGAALADEPLEPALDAIEGAAPALQIVLGDLGDDAAHVEALLRALATLSTPSLVVLGGRDHAADLDAALAALPVEARARVVDASGLRAIELGGAELVPVSGAPDGRYARDDEACGLGADDVDAIASDLGEQGEHARFLVAWAGPAPLPGLEGGEAGSTRVSELAERVGAAPGVFAWPDVASPRLAPALVGPATALADGSRLASGVLVVDLGPSGLTPVPAASRAP